MKLFNILQRRHINNIVLHKDWMLDNKNLCSSSLHNEREAMEDVFNFRFFLQENSAEFFDPLIPLLLSLITAGIYLNIVLCAAYFS